MDMKHIRMTKEEAAKVDAYRKKLGLSFTMAVRTLLALAFTLSEKGRK